MALVALSALPASAVIASTDISPFVIGGTTKKMTAGNFRTAMFAFAAADPLNVGAITATGNSTITGTLSGITTLTTTTNLTGAHTVSNTTAVTFTINSSTNAATDYTQFLFQRGGVTFWRIGQNVGGGNVDALQVYRDGVGIILNIDTAGAPVFQGSLGVLGTTSLVGLNVSGALSMTGAVSRIVGGGTSLSLRNNANNTDNLILSDAGNASLRGNLVIGGSTVSFSAAVAKILQGVTSLAVRDNADTTDIILINAGGITLTRSLITAVSVTGQAGLNIPHGVAPTSPVNGDMWSTTAGMFCRINGVTKTFTLT